MNNIVLLLIFGVLFSCANDSSVEFSCGEGIVFDCADCEESIESVCGCDGQTYQNICYANCIGIYEYTQGECP